MQETVDNFEMNLAFLPGFTSFYPANIPKTEELKKKQHKVLEVTQAAKQIKLGNDTSISNPLIRWHDKEESYY